ncbi:SRR1-like protein isoform X1 [Lampris incognitus]|uniref:SRR1-like protein isoform X1 n=1 Tax=Lampris incognitus TaxID=2546036 RepID=UPI0024B57D90|nr:SRR1-like protein isoform X1 [Lampris incognitus]
MSDTGNEWQVARRRKGAAHRKYKPLQTASTIKDVPNTTKTIHRIRETISELKCEDFWQEWKELLWVARSTLPSDPSVDGKATEIPSNHHKRRADGKTCRNMECVCYGLGSFSSCVSARYQLAMLLLLLDKLQIPLKHCFVYDPVFSSGERDVLSELGLTILTENEEGKRLTTSPTLFYLMHCGKALYNNLLWKNWSRETLPLLTIIGNSFSGIQDRMIDREFQRDYSYISQAAAVCEERPLNCPPRLIDVFNDTAIITFPTSGLNKLPQSSWAEPPEPQYQHCPDLEIILRGDRKEQNT